MSFLRMAGRGMLPRRREQIGPERAHQVLEVTGAQAVAGGVIRAQRREAAVQHGDVGGHADRLEAHLHLGVLVGPEAARAKAEHEPARWIPDPDLSDLEALAVRIDLEEATARARLEA